MSSGVNLLDSFDEITVVHNNVNELHTLTITSIDTLQGELDKIYTKTDSNILLNSNQVTFNVQAPLIFTLML